MKNRIKSDLNFAALTGIPSLMMGYLSYETAKLIPYTYETFIKNAESTEQLIRFSTLEGLLGFTAIFCAAGAGLFGYFSGTHLKDAFSRQAQNIERAQP